MSSKASLRHVLLSKRQSVKPADHALWSLACSRKLSGLIESLCDKTRVIAGYISFKAEINIIGALDSCANRGHCIALPRIVPGQKELLFARRDAGRSLVPNSYGIDEPGSPHTVTPDVIMVPLVAFDRSGQRIGYGGGYYDATLRAVRAKNASLLAIGAAFSLQEKESIPADAHDERLDWVVTEKEVIRTR